MVGYVQNGNLHSETIINILLIHPKLKELTSANVIHWICINIDFVKAPDTAVDSV